MDGAWAPLRDVGTAGRLVGRSAAATVSATFLLCLCINSPQTEAKSTLCKTLFKRGLEAVETIIWPRGVPYVLRGELPPVWAENAKGVVEPNGRYNTTQAILEYFYALQGPLNLTAYNSSDAISLSAGRITDIEYIWTACNAEERLISLETYVTAKDGWGNLVVVLDFIHTYKFNKNNRICGFSLVSKRQGIMTTKYTPTNPVGKALYWTVLCNSLQKACTGNNTQFESMAACTAFMASIPFGDSDNLDQNSVLCRQLHMRLAEIDPDLHCAHAGPSGGGKCVDHTVGDILTVRDYLTC